ncbi:hypothetical protein GSY71_02435 [Pusillimonas sp. TS35]|uniref:type IV pilus assembly protein FimV n=1 Tax=Paracandidimonas lactea TaxID=2895524 RepID=UPI001371653A|nr:hypothetical protein [Pusillimonas sp. TS35]
MSSIVDVPYLKPWILALTAALACASAQAATLGHSRLVSALGQPLSVDVQVSGLTADERNSLSVAPARLSEWAAAGLTPPVDLATLSIRVVDGYAPGTKIIQLRSTQRFNQPVADLLLDVRSAAGQQRYQVSLLTQASASAGAPAAASASGGAVVGRAAGVQAERQRIRVRNGDTMFAIAQRNAVKGVTVYQMMMALQKANPQAFIEGNVNLVKAGATLSMPDSAALTALSDREARRLFMQHAQAFAAYRQRLAGHAGKVGDLGAPSAGQVQPGGQAAQPANAPEGPRDRLRLSEGARGNGGVAGNALADDAAADKANINESAGRVSQLEENVKHLNEALQARGGAASDLVREGARSLAGSLSGTTAQGGAGTAAAEQGSTPSGVAPAGATASGIQGGAGAQPRIGASGATAASPSDGAASGATAAGASASRAGNSDTGAASAGGNGGQAVAGNTAATAASSGAQTQAGGSAGTDAGASQASGATAGDGQAAAQSGASSQSGSGVASQGQADDPGKSANEAAASNSKGGPQGAPETSSNKAGQAVSWFQEHTLGVITGVLALIVLIIAWLLRRVGAAKSDGRDGVITEAMVQEKLDQISLDLDEPSQGESRAPRG